MPGTAVAARGGKGRRDGGEERAGDGEGARGSSGEPGQQRGWGPRPRPPRYLGTQLGLEPSISQVAKRFIGTGRPRAPVPPGKLRRLRSAAAAMAVPAALARAHRAGPPPPRPAPPAGGASRGGSDGAGPMGVV